jgi:crossover junction endodeoxyribonuclease RuvC
MPKLTAQSIAFLGVDPGTQGGMTVLGADGRPKGFCEFSKVTEHSIYLWLERVNSRFELRAAIENVHAMPGQGVTAMFTFGKAVGFARGILIALKIPYVEVDPRKWQNFFAIPPRQKKTKTDHKKVIQAKAHQLFPAYVNDITREVADSILIAEWLRESQGKKYATL